MYFEYESDMTCSSDLYVLLMLFGMCGIICFMLAAYMQVSFGMMKSLFLVFDFFSEA